AGGPGGAVGAGPEWGRHGRGGIRPSRGRAGQPRPRVGTAARQPADGSLRLSLAGSGCAGAFLGAWSVTARHRRGRPGVWAGGSGRRRSGRRWPTGASMRPMSGSGRPMRGRRGRASGSGRRTGGERGAEGGGAVADKRGRAANRREREADERERAADEREAVADKRERAATERAAQLAGLIGELRGLVSGAHRDALEAIERSRALLL